MRNLKKVIALVLAVALTMSTFTVAFAAEKTNAEKLVDMGLLLQTDDLDNTLTRALGIAIVMKAVGVSQAVADATTEVSPFTDDNADAWYAGFATLAAKAGITNGVTATSFGGEQPLTQKMFVTWMLRALGYDATQAWDKAEELAVAAGLVTAIGDAQFKKADAVDVMFAALTADVQGAPVATKLIDALIAKGVVTKEAAVAAGVIAGDIAIASAAITGVKTVTVKFNQAVDTTKAVLKVKKGAAIYGSTVAWNDAKDTATLTTIVNLPAADYAVEVTGLTTATLTQTFTVKDAVASKLEVTSTTVALANNATIEFKVSNQYGEDMKINGTTPGIVVSAYNTTQKRVEALTNLTADNKLTFSATFATAAAPAKLGDVIRVTATYAGLSTQSNVTVVDPSASATIAFSDVAPLTGKARISVNETGLKVPYTLFDQFGAATKLAAYVDGANDNIATISGVQFVSSNPAVVDVDTFAVNADGVLTFTAGATAGTTIITAVINASGAVATLSITVNGVGVVDSLVIAAPSALIAAGETTKLDLTAADQFGTAIAAKDIPDTLNITTAATSGTAVVAGTIHVVKGQLVIPTVAAGTTVVTVKNIANDKVLATVTVVAEAAAVATEVKSVSFGTKFEVGAVKAITTDDFVVIDQYGRTMDKALFGAFSVAEKVALDDRFSLAGTTFTADIAGSQVFVLTAAPGVTKEFTLEVVASADVTSYAITAVPTMFSGAAHAKALELVGKTAAGATVILKADKITQATTSNSNVATVAVALGVATVTGVLDADSTAVIALWNGATKLAETTVTVSKVAPVITSIKFNDTVETSVTAAAGPNHTATISDNLEIKDQYGVVIAGGGLWTTSDATKATVAGGVVTGVAAGDVTIGYVTANGLVATTTIAVQ